MIYRISHRTIYEYQDQVSFCQNKAHLKPRGTTTQRIESCELKIVPAPVQVEESLDFYGNNVTTFSIHESHQRLIVEVISQVECLAPPQVEESLPWNVVESFVRTDLSVASLEAVEFLYPSTFVTQGKVFRTYAESCFPPKQTLLRGVKELNKKIFTEFKYVPLSTTVSTPITEVFEKRRGVCQDFAHLMIACLRSLGIPARYVSGYLRTIPPPGKPRLIGADASHAWISVYSPGQGWVDFDPTNNRLVDQDHVTIAWGRDYSDVSPLRGIVLGGAGQSLQVSVDVEPLSPTSIPR